jgi:hypothetical protein
MALWCNLAVGAEYPVGDFNQDCRVDMADLQFFARQWLAQTDTPADLNDNDYVDGVDFARFAGHWRERTCPIVINEVLAHAHAEASDWVELYNLSSSPVHIGGWFLSDNENDLDRYEIPADTIIPPRGYYVLYEVTQFGNPLDPGARKLFAFSENRDVTCLFSGDDPVFPGCLIVQPFGASETSMPFGRYRTSTGRYDFVTMSLPTPGTANAYPLVGPVVINEIMYHPPDDADAEYVELLNISGGPVMLFDPVTLEPWRLQADTGVDFWFPRDPPVTLQADEHLLLIRDADAMDAYHVPADANVFDWGSGKLNNGGEALRLLKPGDVDVNGIRYWILVDEVAYSDGAHGDTFADGIDPWPTEADGSGLSLNRIFPSRYGNDPNNWQATIPSPGSVND